MLIDPRKRRINIDGKIIWSSKTRNARRLRDVKALKRALRGCNSRVFVQALADSLDDARSETIQTFATTLLPLAKPDTTPRHCVRCHRTYTEPTNTIKSCSIICTEPERTNLPDQESDRPWDDCMWQFPCCGQLATNDEVVNGEWEGVEGFEFDVCFTAKHTTDPTLVKYCYLDEDEQGDEIDYSGMNENVRTCKAMGCGKKRMREGL
ncbi:hypothetical protein FRC07_008723 [Ceratobasidium sp. 392]|nr:hypothetical protein FRC07_008723 [Ceratobasidium sp. 392]